MERPAPRAAYASDPDASRGRLRPEPESPTRSCFQRDRDRIVHSTAFRRLQYKTQVFLYHEGDHYRTRLTHTLEVAQIARTISRALGLDEDLAEATALAHDLGHTPFGHAGEDALNGAMEAFGGFDHNDQTVRILTRLEHRYADFDGLNLTWEALDGVVKHNGPLVAADSDPVPPTIAVVSADHDLDLTTYASAEAQVAALADDIAYNNHDIDDGLRADLFDFSDLDDVPLVGPVFREVRDRYPGAERSRLSHEAVRRLIDLMVTDLLSETGRRLREAKPSDADAVRAAGYPMVAFSAAMRQNDRALKAFLFERMYRHARVNEMTARAQHVVRDLFAAYGERPDRLPAEWRADAQDRGEAETARMIADYIAGMTDRFALEEHRRLFGTTART